MADEQVSTDDLRARGQYARRRLELGWRPSGRTVVREGPDTLVSMVEVGIFARALELVEAAAEAPEGLDGDAALGWRAGAAAAVEALRTVVDYQADRLPPPSAPRSRRDPVPASAPVGIDWCG